MRPLMLVALCVALYLPGLFTLPPIDRDEARFAQASRQMLATGDFIRPRFLVRDRFKKPIGIYWLQSIAVSVAGVGQRPLVWAYRLPSLMGALTAVLLTYAIGRRLFDDATAFLAAALLGSSLLLVVESHLATTDAALLACIVAAQGCLSMLFITEGQAWCAAGFWVAQAFGILLKGPVAPLVSGLTLLTLFLSNRRLAWRLLRPSWGIPLLLAIVAPWTIAVGMGTNWSFFTEAWRGDLLPKLAGAHESHWGPPGYYLLLSPVTFWPGSLVAALGVAQAWLRRAQPAERFCLAWLVPAWIAFELVPTKLPHYVLPLYPPLALLAARAAYATVHAPSLRRIMGFAARGWTVLTLALALLIAAGPLALGFVRITVLLPAMAAAVGAFVVLRLCRAGRLVRATQVAIVGAAITVAPLLEWVLPNIDTIWLSRSVARAVDDHGVTHAGARPLAVAGYDEPSLVFLLGPQLELVDGTHAADFLDRHTDGLAVVSNAERAGFERRAGDLGIGVTEVWSGEGINYSKGRRVRLGVFARAQ